MGTRASYVVAYVYATASFGLKLRIEKVGRNRKSTAVNCHRHLSFSEEEKIRLRGGEVVGHRLEIRSKTANVAEVNVEKIEGSIKTPVVVTWEAI